MIRLWYVALALCLSAHVAGAQLGRVLNVFDAEWERIQRHNPWTYQLDNRDWKTWPLHGGVTIAFGYALSLATPMRPRTGRWVMAGFYVAREVYGVTVERNRKYLDATMDAAVPLLVARWKF